MISNKVTYPSTDICFVPFNKFALFRSVAPGETYSILCDHAGVSNIIYFLFFLFYLFSPIHNLCGHSLKKKKIKIKLA